MKNELLYTLFLENPYLPEAIHRFCQTLPEYGQAQTDYRRAAADLQAQVDHKSYLRYEEALNRCWAEENRAYYLFGLHLRRTALEELGAGERPAP